MHISVMFMIDWVPEDFPQLFQTVKASDNSYATVEQGEELLI